jgi:hypothetical protein
MLLESKNKQVWFVNCKLQSQQQRLFIGYGYIGYVSEQEQELFNTNGKSIITVTIPDDALNQYGCSQFNFYLPAKQNTVTRL